jgi:3-methyladenine DNA glycosylase AlkC
MADALKDTLYTREGIEAFATAFKDAHDEFDSDDFLARVYDVHWPDLALKQRMRQITLALHENLPDDFRLALRIIHKTIPSIGHYGWMTLSFHDYVELYGLDDLDAAIPALEEFTPLCSSEFAVRPFIINYPERMMQQMLNWTQHPSPEVRRLASEGCRPRLPWGVSLPALKKDPSPILPVLDALKLDESEFVRRSVANNLNDIAKDNPQVVIRVLRQWNADHDGPEIDWITRHALRTLLKAGEPDALAILGYAAPKVVVSGLVIEPERVTMGGKMQFSFTVQSTSDAPQNLMIDYVVYLMRANGKQSQKVFKLTKRSLQPGERVTLTRKQDFKPISTRKYYPGDHAIEIQINGQRFERQDFVLVE